jgi:galactokinase
MFIQDTVSSVARDFELRYGQPPSGLWSAPGRVNLIGEHTDYNQGFVFPLAIQYRATVAAGPRSDGKLCISSRQFGEVELLVKELQPRQQTSWWSYAAGAVWSVAQHGDPPRTIRQAPGLQLVIDSDVPVGAGLSSSAAIECAVALAAAHLAGIELDAPTLARVAHRAEYEFVGVPCGTMDQTISACARAGSALLIDCQSGEQRVVHLKFASADLRLVVIDTCAPHRLADGEYAERRQTCEAAARALGLPSLRAATAETLTAQGNLLTPQQLRRARHVVTENERVLAAVDALQQRDFHALGGLLTASHVSLRDDFQVTVPELDEAVQSALSAGALGARMTGGGFGGSVLALCPVELEQELQSAVRAGFERCGFAAPRFFVAEASEGAKRLR